MKKGFLSRVDGEPVLISLGRNCHTKIALRYCGKSPESPFDSISSTSQFVQNSLENNFSNWWELDQYVVTPNVNDFYNIDNISNLDIDDLEDSPLLIYSTTSDFRSIHDLTAASIDPVPTSYEQYFSLDKINVIDELSKVFSRYKAVVENFQNVVTNSPGLVFVREEWHKDFRERHAVSLFHTLYKYCHPSKFKLVMSLSWYTDWKQIVIREEPQPTHPYLIFQKDGCELYVVYNMYYENVKMFKFMKPFMLGSD